MRTAIASVLLVAAIGACGSDRDSSDPTSVPVEITVGGAEPTDEPIDDTADTAGTSAPDGTDTTTASAETTAPSDTTSDSTGDTTETTIGGEIGETEADYVDAIVGDFQGENVVTATCIAEAVVAAIGLEQLQSAGVTTQALVQEANLATLGVTIEDRAALEAALADCGEGDLILTLSELEPTPEALACAEEHVSDELVAEVVVDSLLGGQPSEEAQAAADDFDTCLAPTESTTPG
ncbi:hypothetical protein BH18ACT2_BH18ACT2_13510 [soil metagenome]